MWKQSVGDWEERRHRRSGPLPTTSQTNLPESVADNEHNEHGFLPREFHDRVPVSAYPASDGVKTRPRAAPQTPQNDARALTERWVTVTGASPDDVLDVRDFLDANVGRTVSHFFPPHAGGRSAVYIQFASTLKAAQAVRTGRYRIRVESGVAALGIKRTIDAEASGAVRPHHQLEIGVSWCADQIFLVERETLRRQLLESAAPSPMRSSSVKLGGSFRGAERDAPLPSLESSARGSERVASPGAANGNGGDDGSADAAGHPLLPRHRFGQVGGPQLSQSPWSSHLSSSPSPASSSSTPHQHVGANANITTPTAAGTAAHTNASANPPVRDPAAYYQTGGAYQYEDSFFSDGLHSTDRSSRQRNTVLSLFFHPYSSSYGTLYFLCLYTPLRLTLLLLWTLCNTVRQLLPRSSLRTNDHLEAQKRNAVVVPAGAVLSLLPRSHWRQRRNLCVSDVVPNSASPLEYLAFLLYKYIPFTPDPGEVDVVLWSWLALRSPYPQRSLHLLKQSLLVRQRSTDTMVGQLRPGDDGAATDNSDINQLTRFGRVDVLGAEPYNTWEQQQQVERHRELPVLLRWRPAWWFARYSSLSLLLLAVLGCCHIGKSTN